MKLDPMLASFALLFAPVAVLACGQETKPIPDPVVTPSPPRTAVAPSASAAPPTPEPADTFDVVATVVDESGGILTGRDVVLVDRIGRRQKARTDSGGGLVVQSVSAPYDLAIEGAVAGPTVYLGVRRAMPRFVVAERGEEAPCAATQRIRVVLDLQACAAERCWLSVATSSRSGSGYSTRTVAGNERFVTVTVDHAWTSSSVPVDESIVVSAIAGDDGYSAMMFGEVATVARPGEATDVGAYLRTVPVTPPTTIVASGPDEHSAEWSMGLTTRLRLAGGTALELHRVEGPALVTRFPRIEGARMEVEAVAIAANPPRNVLQRASVARSGTLPVDAAQVLLDLPRGIDFLRPGEHGRVSRRARGLAWQGPPGLTTVSLETGSKVVAHVVTGGDEIAFGRLRLLGLATLDVGDYVLDVTNEGERTMDDAVDAEPPLDRAPRTKTHQRLRFQLVP